MDSFFYTTLASFIARVFFGSKNNANAASSISTVDEDENEYFLNPEKSKETVLDNMSLMHSFNMSMDVNEGDYRWEDCDLSTFCVSENEF